jgi:rsbT co-antagonist protein RsbR
MTTTNDYAARISQLIQDQESAISTEWLAQLEALTVRVNVVSKEQLRNHCQQFMKAFVNAIRGGNLDNIEHRTWDEVRDLLAEISSTRAKNGSTPSETATFVFSIKQPLFAHLSSALAGEPAVLAASSWTINNLLDKLGLYTIEVFQKARDQIIVRQQQELLELSTPVVKLWDGVLAVPLVGTLDSARTQVVMETLLQTLVDTGSAHAIIDITGVAAVDTQVAQHLLKTVVAARLMGAECIISGIRPQIAQTVVALGIEFGDIPTKATLADALRHVLRQAGFDVVRRSERAERAERKL